MAAKTQSAGEPSELRIFYKKRGLKPLIKEGIICFKISRRLKAKTADFPTAALNLSSTFRVTAGKSAAPKGESLN